MVGADQDVAGSGDDDAAGGRVVGKLLDIRAIRRPPAALRGSDLEVRVKSSGYRVDQLAQRFAEGLQQLVGFLDAQKRRELPAGAAPFRAARSWWRGFRSWCAASLKEPFRPRLPSSTPRSPTASPAAGRFIVSDHAPAADSRLARQESQSLACASRSMPMPRNSIVAATGSKEPLQAIGGISVLDLQLGRDLRPQSPAEHRVRRRIGHQARAQLRRRPVGAELPHRSHA